ncbi:hypothetical protein ACWD25_02400 [Streptomyces sp. NPDC002920]
MTVHTLSDEQELSNLRRSGDWRSLTAVEQKYQYFSTESYFRESWEIASAELGSGILRSLQRLAMLALKPECILGRKGEAVLEYMAHNGFRPIIAQPFHYDRHRTREIWRFQWNIATLDRLQLGDLLHTTADSLMVLFLDERNDSGLPGSVRLAGLKGSSLPWERGPEHLRTHLAALNRMIVFVHCSDEPVDIVRELGILFDPMWLRKFYRRIGAALSGGVVDNVAAELMDMYNRFPARALDVADATQRVRAGLANVRESGAGAARRADQALAVATGGDGKLDWRMWSAALDQAGRNPAGWDEILVATHYILHDLPNERCIISESGRERWLAGEGRWCP